MVLEMDGIAMVAAEAPDEALRLLEAVPEANTWNVMGGALTQAVAEALDLEEGSRCYQAAYFRGDPLPVRADVRPLDHELLPGGPGRLQPLPRPGVCGGPSEGRCHFRRLCGRPPGPAS